MKKYIAMTVIVFLIAGTSYAMQSVVYTSVIPEASYLVYDGDSDGDIVGGVSASSRNVTFYTFDGNPITTIEHGSRFFAMSRKLDRSAPKPRPLTYKIKCWPDIRIGFGLAKGGSVDFILFYDKNGNKIDSFCYDKVNRQITIFSETVTKKYHFNTLKDLRGLDILDFPLDLSIVCPGDVGDQAIERRCAII